MCWNRNSVVNGLFGLQDDVTPDLVNPSIAPMLAKQRRKLFAAEVAWQLHASVSISSRTK